MFFGDGLTQSGNPHLHPERGRNFEIAAFRDLASGWRLTLSAYRTDLRDLIVARRDDSGLIQSQNFSADCLRGLDGGITGRMRGIDVGASLAIQNASDTTTGSALPNAPRQVGKFRIAIPLFRNHLTAAGSASWLSRREDMERGKLASVFKPDVTLTTDRLARGFDLQLGVRNLFDHRIYDPVALNENVPVIPRPGREIFLRLIWRSDD
jgi:outer membrane cobalamin receptor